MSLPDPIPVATNPASTFARVWSANPNQSVFRKEFENGTVYVLTATQGQTKTRKRHLLRLDTTPAPVNGIIKPTSSFTLTIDEPIQDSLPDVDMLYMVNVLKSTLTNDVINRLLNGEL